MNLCKISHFYASKLPSERENQSSVNHCNIAKQKIRKGLKRSKEKMKNNVQNVLKQSTSNIPLASINLNEQSNRKFTVYSLQKCKSQLSLQKQILLKELQSKQQKLQVLRQTVRNIQSSRPKLLLSKDEKAQKAGHIKKNTDITALTSGPQYRSKPKQHQTHRQRASNSKQLLGLMQRTRLFPTTRPFE